MDQFLSSFSSSSSTLQPKHTFPTSRRNAHSQPLDAMESLNKHLINLSHSFLQQLVFGEKFSIDFFVLCELFLCFQRHNQLTSITGEHYSELELCRDIIQPIFCVFSHRKSNIN